MIEEANKYARKQGRSLSGLVEDYLRSFIEPPSESNDEFEYSPIVKSLKGAVKLEENGFDYREVLEEELVKRYLPE